MNRAPATYDWTGDSSQWPQAQKLASLNPDFRDKILRVNGTLTAKGFQWKIVFGWRSEAKQLELFETKVSKVRWSFHCATLPDGTPNALAVDIIDKRWAWNSVEVEVTGKPVNGKWKVRKSLAEINGFWAALGDAGKAEGLYWGGDWAKFPDVAHLQAVPNSELAAIRRASQGVAA